MPTFSGRLKLSLFGALTLWIFARSVFAMPLAQPLSQPSASSPVASVDAASIEK
jgi:hypothetical protein